MSMMSRIAMHMKTAARGIVREIVDDAYGTRMAPEMYTATSESKTLRVVGHVSDKSPEPAEIREFVKDLRERDDAAIALLRRRGMIRETVIAFGKIELAPGETKQVREFVTEPGWFWRFVIDCNRPLLRSQILVHQLFAGSRSITTTTVKGTPIAMFTPDGHEVNHRMGPGERISYELENTSTEPVTVTAGVMYLAQVPESEAQTGMDELLRMAAMNEAVTASTMAAVGEAREKGGDKFSV